MIANDDIERVQGKRCNRKRCVDSVVGMIMLKVMNIGLGGK